MTTALADGLLQVSPPSSFSDRMMGVARLLVVKSVKVTARRPALGPNVLTAIQFLSGNSVRFGD